MSLKNKVYMRKLRIKAELLMDYLVLLLIVITFATFANAFHLPFLMTLLVGVPVCMAIFFLYQILKKCIEIA